MFSALGKKKQESKLKTHNPYAHTEVHQLCVVLAYQWPSVLQIFQMNFCIHLLFMAKPFRTLLGHLKIHVDTSFSGVGCNSIVTKSLSQLLSSSVCSSFQESVTVQGLHGLSFFPIPRGQIGGKKVCRRLEDLQPN